MAPFWLAPCSQYSFQCTFRLLVHTAQKVRWKEEKSQHTNWRMAMKIHFEQRRIKRCRRSLLHVIVECVWKLRKKFGGAFFCGAPIGVSILAKWPRHTVDCLLICSVRQQKWPCPTSIHGNEADKYECVVYHRQTQIIFRLHNLSWYL